MNTTIYVTTIITYYPMYPIRKCASSAHLNSCVHDAVQFGARLIHSRTRTRKSRVLQLGNRCVQKYYSTTLFFLFFYVIVFIPLTFYPMTYFTLCISSLLLILDQLSAVLSYLICGIIRILLSTLFLVCWILIEMAPIGRYTFMSYYHMSITA